MVCEVVTRFSAALLCMSFSGRHWASVYVPGRGGAGRDRVAEVIIAAHGHACIYFIDILWVPS